MAGRRNVTEKQCQFLIGKVQPVFKKNANINSSTLNKLCQFLIGKVQQENNMNGYEFKRCQFLIGKVQHVNMFGSRQNGK